MGRAPLQHDQLREEYSDESIQYDRLKLTNIGKSFGPVRALEASKWPSGAAPSMVAGRKRRRQVDAAEHPFRRFEPSSGHVEVDGVQVVGRGPLAARRAGIAMIHQELQHVPELTVAQNMFLGRPLKTSGGIFVARRMQERAAAEALAPLDPSIDPSVPIRTLKVAQRQIVEIARAMMEDAKVLAMDEPTSSLTPAEFERLAVLISELAGQRRLDHLCFAQDGRGLPRLRDRDDPSRRAQGDRRGHERHVGKRGYREDGRTRTGDCRTQGICPKRRRP